MNEKKTIKLYFQKEIIVFIFLVMIEIINSYIICKQPIILGFRAARFCVLYLLYFPISIILEKNNAKLILKNIIIIMGGIAASLNIIQYFSGDKMQLLYVPFNERYEDISFSVAKYLIIISFFFIFSKILEHKNKRNNYIYILIGIVEIFSLVFIAKTRMVLFGVCFALVVVIMIQKKYSKIVIMCLTTICLILFIPYMKNSIINKAYNLTKEEIKYSSGTYGVRMLEYNFYMDQALKTPILGRGILNKLHPESLMSLGTENGMYLSDIGVFGMFFKYGVLGIIWYVLLLKKLYQKVILLHKNNKLDYGILAYIIYITVTSLTAVIIDYPSVIIYNALMFAILDNDIRSLNKDNSNIKSSNSVIETSNYKYNY